MGNVLGIIAEYNPFHNGHFYHLQKSKELTNSKYCVCVISGNFTQRGEPSIVDKWSKAYMALCGGADLVLELPTVYSTSSAENFASGAIKLLDSLKIVDNISFGAECDNIQTLDNIANVLYSEPPEYRNILNHELSKGISFPAARENALMMYLNDVKRYANVVSNSNNILAIEYLKALKKTKSTIQPLTVLRKNVKYSEEKIVGEFASATGIRKFMEEKDYQDVRKVVPKSTYKIIGNNFKDGNIILGLKQYEKQIVYILRKMTIKEIADLPDVSEGLEYSIKRAAESSNKIDEIIEFVKTKRYTQTRIQRIMVYALLGINKKIIELSKKITPYARILGFNDNGRKLISEIKRNNPKINMITSVSKFLEKDANKLSKGAIEIFNKDMLATDVYTTAFTTNGIANLDYTHNMIIIK